MLKAAEKAEKINNKNLSEMIKEEINKYKCARKIKAEDIYNRIYEVVLDCPTISYQNLIKSIAREYGNYPEEFEVYYKKCREVYDTSRKEIRLAEEMRVLMKKRLSGE
jgi:hypothetical protein